MKKLLTVAALTLPALSAQAYVLSPCANGSFEVGPYVGIDARFSKLNLSSDQKTHRTRPQPYGYLGLKVHPNWALELGGNLKAHKHRTKAVVSQYTEADGSVVQITRPGLPIKTHKIDLRAVSRFPTTYRDNADWLLGLGVSHLKLKQRVSGLPSLSHGKLVPSALAGVEFNLNPNAKLRLATTYSHALGNKLQAQGVTTLKAKSNWSAHVGLAWHL